MKECTFCKIVEGELPSFKIWENGDFLAFLTIQPIKEGHTLVIPKKHEAYLFDMESNLYSDLMLASKEVAGKLQRSLQPKSGKIGMIVYGLDINHVHIHLVPIDRPGDLNFSHQKIASSSKLQQTLDKINSFQ